MTPLLASRFWPEAAVGAALAAGIWFLRRQLAQRRQEVETLEEVASAISSPLPGLQSVLGAVVSIVGRALKADLVAFLLVDELKGELVVEPGGYGLDGEEGLYRIPLTEENSSSVRVFKTGELFMTGDAQNDPQVISKYTRLWKIHSLMVVPIRSEGKALGVMRVGSFRRHYFTKAHAQLLRVIGQEAAVIIETAMMNRQLRESAERLEALNRIKDDFVSTVSHEFKTPLTTIMGFLKIIQDGEAGEVNATQKKFLAIAQNATSRLTDMVSELLDISKLESGLVMDIVSCPAEGLVAASVANYDERAKRDKKTLAADLPPELPQVMADSKWLVLALDNLVSNALKFTETGGRVTVSAADKGEFVLFKVEDDGIGIPKKDHERIFEKFYRASIHKIKSIPGTGLGLAIVKEIIMRHGGKIWFESEEGKGARFLFVVPTAVRREQSGPGK